MTANAKIQTVLKQIGNPAKIDKELQDFHKAALALSSNYPRLIDSYSKQWIAVYHGEVKAKGRTFQSLMDEVDEKKIPREGVIVRYIDRNLRAMIL